MTRPADSGGQGKPNGFLSRMANALTPPVVHVEDEDMDAPVTRPRTILAATVLTILAGAVFLFLGLTNLTQSDQLEAQTRADYSKLVKKCQDEAGGINQTVRQTPADADDKTKSLYEGCRSLPAENDLVETYLARNKAISIAVTICAAASVAGGLLIHRGNMWGRRLTVAVVVLMMIGVMIMQIRNQLLLGGSFAIVIAVVMCYLASGGAFFQRVQFRRKQT